MSCQDEHSPSGDSEEMIASPKQSTINIMNNIKRKIMSENSSNRKVRPSFHVAGHHHKISNDLGDEPSKNNKFSKIYRRKYF